MGEESRRMLERHGATVMSAPPPGAWPPHATAPLSFVAPRIDACVAANVASVRTILSCGGVFISEEFIPERGEAIQRYQIRIVIGSAITDA